MSPSGAGGSGEAGEGYGSGGKSGNQHEAASFGAGRERKALVVIARRGKQDNGSGSRVLAKYKRIDSDGRRRIRQAAYGLLAGGAAASGNLRGDQRILGRSGYVFAGIDCGGAAEGLDNWGFSAS